MTETVDRFRYYWRRFLRVPLDMTDQIEGHKLAALRGRDELDAMVARRPSCALGRRYSDRCDAQDARCANLARLLRKRATVDDLKLAAAIDDEAWPP